VKKIAEILDVASNKSPTLTDEFIVHPAIDNAETKINEEYRSHLAAIVESSNDAIISKSLDGTIKSWNKGCEKMFGYTAKEIVGKNISLIIPMECINEVKNIIARVTKNETIEPYETVRIKKNGEQLHVSITVSSLKDRAGNIKGVSTIGRDITSRKKAEAALIIANKELAFQNEEKEKRAVELMAANSELEMAKFRLKEVNKELEAFTYSVSHDLRSPLRAVNSYAQILQEDYADKIDEDGISIIESIRYNGEKMGNLIDELLAFSRLGRKEIARTKVSMKELTDAVLSELSVTFPHHAKIAVGRLPSIATDYTLMYQVMFNLVSNALKYSGKKTEPVIEISAIEKNGKTCFVVKDNGAGFDMRFADKLFGVFQRLHAESDFEGNGVGLAIVHRIITKFGGEIWAEGKVNEGATFYFTIN